MDVNSDVIVPIAAAGGTGLSVVFISKLLIQSWLTKYDEALSTIRQLDKSTAVIESQIKTIMKDLDGIANMVRKLPAPTKGSEQ